MEPLEDKLREAFARKAPPPDFTAGVMERVRTPARKHPRLRWTMVGAIAASLLVGAYVTTRERPQVSPEAMEAEAQLLLSLQVAGEKLNKARDRVLRPVAEDSQ